MVEPVKFKKGDLIFISTKDGYCAVHIVLDHFGENYYSFFDVCTTEKGIDYSKRNIDNTTYNFHLMDKLEVYGVE